MFADSERQGKKIIHHRRECLTPSHREGSVARRRKKRRGDRTHHVLVSGGYTGKKKFQ